MSATIPQKTSAAAWKSIAELREDEIANLKQQLDKKTSALEQIKTVCADNSGHNARHDMALKFVGDVAKSALTDEIGTP